MIGVAKSDIGKVRLNNEDAFYIPQKGSGLPELYIVADGMGGHQGGEVASKTAVKEVSTYINNHLTNNTDIKYAKKTLESAIINANNKIHSLSLKEDELYGMGTTITIALFHNKCLCIGHVGDSRAYRIRKNHIEQLTEDHSLVWQLMEQGRITVEETKTHPMKNVITKALGTDESLKPDILEFEIKNNDIIILCSDGLTNMLDNVSIKNIVNDLNPEQAVSKLIEEANLKGGEDNITVAIIIVDKVGM